MTDFKAKILRRASQLEYGKYFLEESPGVLEMISRHCEFREQDSGLRFLADEEAVILSWVATTKSEAAAIRKRNASLLMKLMCKNSNRGSTGCPHCKAGAERLECESCAWIIVPCEGNDKYAKCLFMTFSGYDKDDTSVTYSVDAEYINDTGRMIGSTVLFLAGHLEWSYMILAGHIPEVYRSYRSWTRNRQKKWISKAEASIKENIGRFGPGFRKSSSCREER